MYLWIVEPELGSPRLSRNLIRDSNMGMRHLDSSVGAFAITSLGALHRTFVDSCPCALAAASLLYW